MKVIVATQEFWPAIGGAEKGAMLIAKFCKLRGDEVTVISSLKEGYKKHEVYHDIQIYRIKYPLFRKNVKYFFKFILDFIPAFYNLIKIVYKFKPDVIYVQFLCENAIMISLLSYLYRCRIIVSPTGQNDTFFKKNNYMNRILFQRLLNRANKIIFASDEFYIKTKSATPYVFDNNKAQIIPYGIDVTNFDEGANIFTLPNKKPYIFSCGRIVYDKGFDILIKAFNLIHKKYSDVDLVIAGDGDEREKLESLVNLLHITDRVHFLGFVNLENMAKYYLGCLFFVISTRHEAFPNVILESMAARKAVIGSNAGGIPSIIKDGFNGYLFETENYAALAEKMLFLIENKAERDLLGLNGRQTVERCYMWDKIYQKHLL